MIKPHIVKYDGIWRAFYSLHGYRNGAHSMYFNESMDVIFNILAEYDSLRKRYAIS